MILISALATRPVMVTCSIPTVAIHTQAEYLPGSRGITAPTLVLTFNKTRPSSQQAEALLRACILQVTKTIRVDEEMVANAWYNPAATGTTDHDEGPLTLPDGSRALFFDPNTQRIQTWKEREGIRPSRRDDPKGEYFIEYTEEKRLVAPYDKFATLSIVFATLPTEAAMYEKLIAEVRKAVQTQKPKLEPIGSVKTGPRGNRIEQRAVRGSSGKYIVVYFDPKDGKIRNLDGKVLGSPN